MFLPKGQCFWEDWNKWQKEDFNELLCYIMIQIRLREWDGQDTQRAYGANNFSTYNIFLENLRVICNWEMCKYAWGKY